MDTVKPRVLADAVPAEAVTGEAPEVAGLVARAKAGDSDAFEGLMRLYERRVIALGVQMGLSKDDALDACQDTFVKVFRYIHRFHTGQAFFKWLYRIAINAIHDHRRWSRPAGTVSTEDLDAGQVARLRDGHPSFDRQIESADLARRLLAGLTGLSRRERTVFVLRDLQEMSTDDIGRILNLSQVTVRRHCMAARHKLRLLLFPPAG